MSLPRPLRSSAVCLSILFVVTRVGIFLFLAGRGTDLGVHSEYWARIIGGELPFRDFVPEYPPLVLAFTGVPVLLDRSLHWYFPIFRGLCCAVDCGMWLLIVRLNRGRAAQSLLYILGTTALGPLIYDRVDIVLGGLLLVAIVSLVRGRDRGFPLAVGTGIAFKLIPIVWIPIVLVFEARRGPWRLGRGLLLLALPTMVSFDLMASLGGLRFGEMFAYHADRGIQIESAAASVEMVLIRLGTEGEVSYDHGSVNLHTRYEDVLVHAATALLGAVILISGLVALRRGMDRESMALLLAAVLSAALLLSKVLSPQYFLFLLPVLVALPPPRHRAAAVSNWLLAAALFGLTGAIYPWIYDSLMELKPLGESIVIARNACLAALSICLFYSAWVHSTRYAVITT